MNNQSLNQKHCSIDTRFRELYYKGVISFNIYCRLRYLTYDEAVECIKNDFNINLEEGLK